MKNRAVLIKGIYTALSRYVCTNTYVCINRYAYYTFRTLNEHINT